MIVRVVVHIAASRSKNTSRDVDVLRLDSGVPAGWLDSVCKAIGQMSARFVLNEGTEPGSDGATALFSSPLVLRQPSMIRTSSTSTLTILDSRDGEV